MYLSELNAARVQRGLITSFLLAGGLLLGALQPAAAQSHYQFQILDHPPLTNGALNNHEVIVGSGQNWSTGNDYGIVYDKRGTETDFSIPGSGDTDLYDVANDGSIVGDYDYNNYANGAGFMLRPNGSLWTYQYPGARYTGLNAINDAGTMIGSQFTSSSNKGQFLLRRNGSILPILAPGYSNVDWIDLNNQETLLGTYFDTTTSLQRTLIDRGGIVTTIDIPGAAFSFPSRINNCGDVCGYYGAGIIPVLDAYQWHGYVRDASGRVTTVDCHYNWPATETQDYGWGPITFYFVAEGGTIITGNNDRGQLLGYTEGEYLSADGVYGLGDSRSFIATPKAGH